MAYDVYEVAGYSEGIDRSGVNFLSPLDSFSSLKNAFIYRQILQSRLGFVQFGTRIPAPVRVMGIFENVLPDGTKELLVVSRFFMSRYNPGTNVFDNVPFTSVDPIGSFSITSNDDYVSGTTYLTKSGGQRFVFTGRGMSDVFFYDGTGVKRYTNTTDNPDYQPPPQGALTRATSVIWFGERINFFSPVVGGVNYNQGILYSGIRDAAGNGDKFNVPGSGLLSCDTYELMKGAIILGDIVIMNLQRSNWSLEKTRDVFNPYFTRKIPSVLGTDAGFSAVSWNYEVKSGGKTGMITTDGRQSLRFDNKIPYFTADDFDQSLFELTYGGFDRINGQFLFSYRSNDSTLSPLTQNKVLVNNYEESTWSVNDQRFSVFGQTDVGQDLTWSDIDETQNPAWARMDETEEVWNRIGIQASTQKTLAGDDLGFIYEINRDYDDYFVSISNITQASSAVVTIDESAFQVGDRVIFANVEGMTEINSMKGTVTVASVTSITVDIDSSTFTPYTTGGSVSKLIAFEAEMIPFNPYRSKGRRIFMSHVEFQINTNAGDMFVDIYSDEEEAPFKTALVVSPSNTTKKSIWVNVAVDQESEYLTIVMRNESAGFQTVVTSVRMHCAPGGDTSS